MIKTTRLRDSQVPQNKVYDLSPQCNGQRTVFQLPKRVFPSDKFWLILNGKTLRNDINHTFYTVGLQGTQLTVYFPAPSGTDVLQVVLPNNSEGVQPFATEEYAEAVANLAKQAAITESKGYTDAREVIINNRIDGEANIRENADTGLQRQIDAIVAKADVVDVVGTYAELEAYDTSALGDKDEIKVISDETHDNSISYYRWSASTEQFNYVGSEGPYLTKSEAASDYVPQTRTINGKSLDENISLDAHDVGAASAADLPTKTSDLQNDGEDGTSEYATKAYVDSITGDIGEILDIIHGGNIAIIEVPEEES